MRSKIIFIGCCLFGIAASANAQLFIPKSLQRPIENALENDKSSANKQLEIEKVKNQRRDAIHHYIPTLEAKAAFARLQNDLVVDIPTTTLPLTGRELFSDKTTLSSSGNFLYAGVTAKTVLFSGMQVELGAKALQAKAQAEEGLLYRKKDSIVLEVVNSFDLLRYLEATRTLLEDSDFRLEQEERRVQKAIENGLAIPFDRDKLQLARRNIDRKRAELEGAEMLLYRKLSFLTKMDEQEIRQVHYELEPIAIPQDLHSVEKQELKALARAIKRPQNISFAKNN